MIKLISKLLITNTLVAIFLIATLTLSISLSLGSTSFAVSELCNSETVGAEECESKFQDDTKNCSAEDGTLTADNCRIVEYLVIGINVLSAIAGLVFVFSLMISGFQYMTGRDNAGQIEKAKARIVSTLIAVAVFVFMYALLNFLVPGGVL